MRLFVYFKLTLTRKNRAICLHLHSQQIEKKVVFSQLSQRERLHISMRLLNANWKRWPEIPVLQKTKLLNYDRNELQWKSYISPAARCVASECTFQEKIKCESSCGVPYSRLANANKLADERGNENTLIFTHQMHLRCLWHGVVWPVLTRAEYRKWMPFSTHIFIAASITDAIGSWHFQHTQRENTFLFASFLIHLVQFHGWKQSTQSAKNIECFPHHSNPLSRPIVR